MKKRSRRNRLNRKDISRGFLLAIGTSIAISIEQWVDAGQFEAINWKHVAMAGIGGGIAYLIKNVFTSSDDKLLGKEPRNPYGNFDPNKPSQN
jgi:hypothetical protein